MAPQVCSCKPFILYTDGSAIATGYVLLNDDHVIEDGTKLRSKSDNKHINLCGVDWDIFQLGRCAL
ncbi:hypothetical protein Pmar_PMAR027521 [Perkinsus marinus ATCC 50983]|uniref:Uncharacterized protein n=1 Tax=Perkinsus marinus (strain ATCC 50983 / TXsc) TaxID=423536 RepID=C5LPD0_PERM5|nr:hypothetical protein Pmar_PMAR027521 [Perkinsus marinus ATCC 50983]EER01392.1 hypothetical protein Pmar_PMAR027521 [Perkinsus marinus ATCC 50983]|eukprot:XP_002768674.1 hypothetical protein Pmar_PMAR027521 [Perkinsus marinus ATCC 50983]